MQVKKSICLLLSVIVIVSSFVFSISANALSTINAGMEGNATLTIHKYEMNTIPDNLVANAGEEIAPQNIPEGAKALPGVTFEIKKIANVSSTYYKEENTTDKSVRNLSLPSPETAKNMPAIGNVQTGVTNTQGVIKFENLSLGIYYVHETNAPAHIVKNGKLTTQEKDVVKDFVVALPSTASNGTEWNYNVHVYPKNKSKYQTITINKTDFANAQNKLSGAKFSLKRCETDSSTESDWITISPSSLDSSLTELVTGTNGVLTIPNLPVGNYYKLQETAAPSTYILDNTAAAITKFMINEDGVITNLTGAYSTKTTDTTINITNSKPTIQKYIDRSKGKGTLGSLTTLSSIYRNESNNYQYYVVTVKTPNLNDMSKLKTFRVTDTIKRMKTQNEPVIAKIVSASGTTLSENTDYTFTRSVSQTSPYNIVNTTLTFNPTALTKNTQYSIYYKGYVSITDNVTNSADVVYSTQTDDTTSTNTISSNSVKLFERGYAFKKTDNNGNKLAGAEFKVYSSLTDAKENKNAIYAHDANSNTDTYTFVSNAQGLVKIMDLDVGTSESSTKDYYLVETKAPQGYNILAEPYKITVNSSSLNEANTITVINTPIEGFPFTGGNDFMIFILLGELVVGGSVIAFLIHRRRVRSASLNTDNSSSYDDNYDESYEEDEE